MQKQSVTLIPGVGKIIAKKLKENGYITIGSVADSTPDKICLDCNIKRHYMVDIIKRARIMIEFPNGFTASDSKRIDEIRFSKL